MGKFFALLFTNGSFGGNSKIDISINDALAVIIMERQWIDEIYPFDRHFKQAKVTIVQE